MRLPDHCHRRIPIAQPGDVLVARGIAAELVVGVPLSPTEQDRFSLILTELATNIIRYAPGGGTILLRRLDGLSGLECLCFDRGPGISDVGEALRDGETRGGGLGLGLGAVRRLSDHFEIHSKPQFGTAVLARVRCAGRDQSATLRYGAVMLPMPGQTECGDGWMVRSDGLVAVIDGLGHGSEASIVARRAEAVAAEGANDPVRAVEQIHEALKGTRGAVAMVLFMGPKSVQFAGVGNISATLIGVDKVTRLHSSWGVIGSKINLDTVHELPSTSNDIILAHTDGIAQAVEVFTGQHLRYVDPTLASAIILRDARSKMDDQTIMTIRC